MSIGEIFLVTICAVILTYNEEKYLSQCLQNLSWADEVIVLDSFSDDQTLEIAKCHNAKIVTNEFENYGSQRQFGLDLSQSEWILFVDADEMVDESLAKEIKGVIASDCKEVGWWIPRRNFFWGNEVKYSGWYPDYQLRLMRPEYAKYDTTQVVHEVVSLAGAEGYLEQPFIHYNYDSWQEFLKKQKRYSDFEAQRWLMEGKRVKWFTFILQPFRAFYRRYVTYEGYRDGFLGFKLSIAMVWFEMLVCKNLWKIQ